MIMVVIRGLLRERQFMNFSVLLKELRIMTTKRRTRIAKMTSFVTKCHKRDVNMMKKGNIIA